MDMTNSCGASEIDLDFLRTCLTEAGQLAFGQRGQMIAAVKADYSPVTEVDHQVEDFLIERIAKRYPTHQVLSEESGLHASTADFSWILDPIDGTRSFASGLPIWGISIGVLCEGRPVAGGFFLPVTQELYWGTCQQAFYNDHPLAPLHDIDLDSPLVFLAVSSDFHRHFQIAYPRIRSLGSTAAHLAYVATGAAVGSLARKINLWDIAGLLPVLSAVGAEVVTLQGKPFVPAAALHDGIIPEPLLAAHPSVIDALLNQIQKKNA
jgi:myo-inositol-1(or 4)-monophosphatase